MLVLSLITVFMGSSLALREDTLKKRLAYSTVSQVSYVIFGLMLFHPLALEGAIYQAVFHAIAKNALFMATGAIIYQTHLTQVSQLRGIGGPYSITMWCFTLASLSLVGIPPTGGFVSKWFLAEGALAAETGPMAFWGIGVLMASALLTAGYLLPIVVRAFFPGKDFDQQSVVRQQNTWLMWITLCLLTAAVVLLGMFPGVLDPLMKGIVSPNVPGVTSGPPNKNPPERSESAHVDAVGHRPAHAGGGSPWPPGGPRTGRPVRILWWGLPA